MWDLYFWQVFLVAGGGDLNYYQKGIHPISSTEILVEGELKWTFGKPLPFANSRHRGVSLPDSILMTGINRWVPKKWPGCIILSNSLLRNLKGKLRSLVLFNEFTRILQ